MTPTSFLGGRTEGNGPKPNDTHHPFTATSSLLAQAESQLFRFKLSDL